MSFAPPVSSESVMNNGAQSGNMVDATTASGAAIVGQGLQERIRYDQPTAFGPAKMGEGDLERGYNNIAPDPAKYNVPSAAKDMYFTRREIINAYKDADVGAGSGATPMYQAGTDEEVALVLEMEAQQKIAQYDQYCASMFNYKNIPGGIEAIERINPGFTSRRIAQIYADAAFAAKVRAIEMIGQINCTQEDNIFKMHVDNGLVKGPTLAREREAGKGYMPGNFAKLSRPTPNLNALPGNANQTGYKPNGTLPAMFGTSANGIKDMAMMILNPSRADQLTDRIVGDNLTQGNANIGSNFSATKF